RAVHPRILGRQKAELRDQQQRSVEVARAVILDEGVALAVVRLVEDLRSDVGAKLFPMAGRTFEAELFDPFDRAVESHPGHDFRKGEVSWLAARLPHALIRLLPDRLEVLEQLQR